MTLPHSVVCSAEDRPAWLAARRLGVSGSDVAACLGESRWKSRLSLWLDKTRGAEEQEDRQDLEWGHRMEPVLLQWYRDRTGLYARPEQRLLASTEEPLLMSTLDAFTALDSSTGSTMVPLELKTCSQHKAGEWADGVPHEYVIQLHAQMIVTGTRAARIAVLIGGQHAGWHHVDRNDALVARILREVRAFWELVESNTPPHADGSKDGDEALGRLYPASDESTVVLDGELVDVSRELDETSSQIKALEARERSLVARVKEAMGRAERGVLSDGSGWTWKTQTRAATSSKASTFRVLRRQRAKEE